MNGAALILHSVLLGLSVIIASFIVGWSVMKGAAGVAEAAKRPAETPATLPPISIVVAAPEPPRTPVAPAAAAPEPAAAADEPTLPELDLLAADERARGPGEDA
jgi:hypothetical protein